MSSFQKTPLHIGERITYGFALQSLANQPPVFRRENCTRNEPTLQFW